MLTDVEVTSMQALSIHPGPARARPIHLVIEGDSDAAFAWGVVDGLLQDRRIAVASVSAAPAAAANAVVMAYGLTLGGREGGRRALANFWRRVSHAGPRIVSAREPSEMLQRVLENTVELDVVRRSPVLPLRFDDAGAHSRPATERALEVLIIGRSGLRSSEEANPGWAMLAAEGPIGRCAIDVMRYDLETTIRLRDLGLARIADWLDRADLACDGDRP